MMTSEQAIMVVQEKLKALKADLPEEIEHIKTELAKLRMIELIIKVDYDINKKNISAASTTHPSPSGVKFIDSLPKRHTNGGHPPEQSF